MKTFTFGGILLFNLIVEIIALQQIISGPLVPYESTKSLLFTNEKKIMTKKIVWRLILYPGILSLCYGMLLALHIYEFTELKVANNNDDPPPSFRNIQLPLQIARGIFVLQGFFNALVYLRSSKLRGQYRRYAFFRKIFWRGDDSFYVSQPYQSII
eukprot:gene3792-4373_t